MALRLLGSRVATLNTATARPAPKVAERFYTSPEWIAMRDRVRREADGRCERKGCSNRGFIVDHIIELKDGGAKLDRSNLELLCAPCHGIKTAKARAERHRASPPPGQKSGR